MNDRLEREIDELLARLGVGETRQAAEPAAPPRSLGAEIRRQIPGSPVRLMLLSLALLVGLALFLPILVRPILPLAGALLLLGYITWLFEPDPPRPGQRPGWFARLYRRLYGA